MSDYASCGEDYEYSDDEDYSADAYESDEIDYQLVTTKASTIQVITKEWLLAAQREDMQSVMDLLSVKEHHARLLLIYHDWDVEKLFAVYMDNGVARLFEEAGLALDKHHHSNSSVHSIVMCEICIEDVPSDEATRMDCGHCFCNTCWTQHFVVKINEGISKNIRCMAHKCYSICDEAVVRTLLGRKHPDIVEKYEHLLLESYIEDNKRVKWCPSTPHCGNVIRNEGDKLREVECSCGEQFCFSCLSEPHSPCSCEMWKLWARKCQDESETLNWIAVHTKPCPKCGKLVEKSGGCNLVTCVCGQYFCWLCGEATGQGHTMISIADHSCGRYEEQEESAERAKRELNRYMHYYNRYKAHTESFKLESKLKEIIQGRIDISEEKDSKIRDYSWVINGLSKLFRSRRILSYSYPFAFYMFGEELFKGEMLEAEREIKKNLFEDQQQQFEANVEKMSQILEEPFDMFHDEKVLEMRMQIINLSIVVEKLCQKMYDCIQNDLLGSLRKKHDIAPYRSNGIERASKPSVLSNKS